MSNCLEPQSQRPSSGGNLVADAPQKIAEFSEAQRAKRKAPDRLHFPLATQDVDGGLNRTAVVSFHSRAPSLQNCAYFPVIKTRYTMLLKGSVPTTSLSKFGRPGEPREMGEKNDFNYWCQRKRWQSGFAGSYP